ncbi:hypothetical protein K3495_g12455 [Podosphaera aphanis]|nr:hypothetical protein K3495_g12455 [Podosphaera aphanis]
MGKSYTIRQISGKHIPRHYHGDSLKRFRLREGYLVTGEEEALPVFQNIRLQKAEFKLPRKDWPGAIEESGEYSARSVVLFGVAGALLDEARE